MNYCRADKSSKQQELFPFILDQESIDNYVQYQKDLNEWKDAYQKYVDAANANLRIIDYCKVLKDSENFNELDLRRRTENANEALQTCTKNLAGITDQMNRLQEAIGIYNEVIVSYSMYTESTLNKI
ncbi:hypothetical protein N9D36_07075 [Gammaproteobacteria bacterium]|nr:hypothetical protein [Gammaproteobacteria bacterium]